MIMRVDLRNAAGRDPASPEHRTDQGERYLPRHQDAEPASNAGRAAPAAAASASPETAASAGPDTGAAGPETGAASPDTEAAGPETGASTVIVVPGVPRYRRPDCRLIRFLSEKDTQSVTREQAVASGCSPCPDCQPEMSPAGAGSPGR
jgi:hypothetical protein